MKRREFIALLSGAAATWPFAVWAQQPERIRRVGILLPATADNAEFQTWIGAFLQALALLGWTIGRNLQIDTRWATSNAADIRRHASELAALAPNVILAHDRDFHAIRSGERIELQPVGICGGPALGDQKVGNDMADWPSTLQSRDSITGRYPTPFRCRPSSGASSPPC